ncbi:tRNA (adenosine(37)-N6)-threonylcarbamoyltransferase complex dimerization subunit type 1 TsaB [Leptotrichia sp. OH3620_COT-345]|uniref:tRNA (adenosine(37)-N6)-threonylcarbamoyltransferase complex dimerization subunit type 1 TsaB n=1 Tax=Leptotrichia sp. OH3620_COT-345 TaxID=2491048 RepID=UPI000F65356D|nr:tRNA (adenosine(37)-N6)-threonylcarbamoyltransferase complex dimerization subunit type 1 TsaB [Leptotrichia sp. OH3620_COT-345]RRD39176.1 tRNA (adenosine(37)-N6)-threonylcarbamoyltransferase complex dimerization subunit type 1 TsaB [Leptotrichia sp. OH3620_COT-345]
MLIFSITTATKTASVSLCSENRILGEIRVEVAKTHSTTILEQIDRLFEWTGKKIKEVDKVTVSSGPGSFTGVRIAISVVKGLFYGKDVEIYEVNELDALAHQACSVIDNISEKEDSGIKIYSMIDSGKEKIYYSVYEIEEKGNLKKIKDYKADKLQNIIENIGNKDTVFLTGGGAFNYKEKIVEISEGKVKFLNDRNIGISSLTFAEMFLKGKLKRTDIFGLKPYYLEKSQAERDKK